MRSSCPTSVATSTRLGFTEFRVFLGLLAVALLLWIGTLPWSPVGPDEPSYKDPAANFVLGKGFTSGAWYGQTATEFWAGNVPLHALAQIPWFATFGISMLASRSFEWFFVLAGTLILYAAVARLGLIPTPKARLLFIALWLGQTSTYSLVSQGRPDALGVFIVASLMLAWSISAKCSRLAFLFILSALVPWSGLQLIVAVALVLVPLFILFRTTFMMETAAIVGGMFLGSFALLAFYHLNNALIPFINSAMPHTTMGGLSIYTYNGWILGKSFWFVLLSAGCLVLAGLVGTLRAGSRPAVALLLCGYFAFAFPVLLFFGGKFTTNYVWMPALGFLITFFKALSAPLGGWGVVLKSMAVLFAALSGLYGPVESLGVALSNDSTDVHQRVEAYVNSHITSSDRVVYTQFAFYPVKTSGAQSFYSNWYSASITPQEKQEVTLLLCSPHWAARYEEVLGFNWIPVDSGIEVPVFRFLRQPLCERLVAYRRPAQ